MICAGLLGGRAILNSIIGEKDNNKGVRLVTGAVGVLLLPLPLTGSADPGSTSPGMRGEWRVLVDGAPNDCGRSSRHRLAATVNREGIEVRKAGAITGEGLRATVDGRDLRFDVVYTSPSGLERLESVRLHLENGLLTGTSSYTEIRGEETCSGTASALGVRKSRTLSSG